MVTSADTETAHHFLRRESRGWHAAVEDAFAGWDIRSRSGLGAFLTAQARAVLAIEGALDRCGVRRLCPDWEGRKRARFLVADLQALGYRTPAALDSLTLDSDATALGALYVIEGSRLGGKLLARTVRQSADAQVRQAVRFFEHEPEPQAWASFRALLDRAPADRTHLLRGAEQAFQCFISSAHATQEAASLFRQAEHLPASHQHDKIS